MKDLCRLLDESYKDVSAFKRMIRKERRRARMHYFIDKCYEHKVKLGALAAGAGYGVYAVQDYLLK